MDIVHLLRGQYWGNTSIVRSSSNFNLTLCNYKAHSHFPRHVHELSGIFFLVSGDHNETDSVRNIVQPQLSGLWHHAEFAHETFTGQVGMVGLNISMVDRANEEILCQRPSRVLDEPEFTVLGARLVMALRQELPAQEIEDRTCEILGFATATRHDASHWLSKVQKGNCWAQQSSHVVQPLRSVRRQTKLVFEFLKWQIKDTMPSRFIVTSRK